MHRETEIALKNYIWLAQNRDAVIHWDTETLVYGQGGVHVDQLTEPGLSLETAHYGYGPGSRKHDPARGMLELVHDSGRKTFNEPAWYWKAADGTKVDCTDDEIAVLHAAR
ncbi:hypothetical protein [Microbacterium oleivorans]|uniref:Uncharacterized protein n=1 Tax=Microbacterium oleivorans TaxID=273677 RepID=A0A031FRC6_9MICO|nr:hypothetical protein [Microbacterium oleivorans]EZP26862.1 hypothetical protein BW34_02064 [Microbacterium oleivorans]